MRIVRGVGMLAGTTSRTPPAATLLLPALRRRGRGPRRQPRSRRPVGLRRALLQRVLGTSRTDACIGFMLVSVQAGRPHRALGGADGRCGRVAEGQREQTPAPERRAPFAGRGSMPVGRSQHHHQRQALRQRRAGRTLRACEGLERYRGHRNSSAGADADTRPDAGTSPHRARFHSPAQAQRKASDGAGNEQKQGSDAERPGARNSAANLQVGRDLRLVSASPGVSEEWSRGESNPRALAESPGEYADSNGRAAPGAARDALGAKRGAGRGPTGGPPRGPVPPTSRPDAGGGNATPDADLAQLVAAWANLPPDVRAGIVAALRMATPTR